MWTDASKKDRNTDSPGISVKMATEGNAQELEGRRCSQCPKEVEQIPADKCIITSTLRKQHRSCSQQEKMSREKTNITVKCMLHFW